MFFASDYRIGLSQVLTDQAIALEKAGAPIYAIAGENEQEVGLTKRMNDAGVQLERINGLDSHAEFKNVANKINQIIVRERIEVVHVQNNWQLALVNYAKHCLKGSESFKIIYTIHGFRNNHPVKSYLAQAVISSALLVGADHVICMTDWLKRMFGLLRYKIFRLPLGIDENYFTEEYIALPTDSLRMVFPAQFRDGKNQYVLIRAFADFVKETNDKIATLTLPGAGPNLQAMQHLANDLGVANQVKFPGMLPKSQILELYLNSNVALVSSNSETFGQSIVEPFVLGRCVVSTPVGIAPEIINNGENGFLFDTQNELKEIMLNLHRNKEMLTHIGRSNFMAKGQFHWKNITARYCTELLSIQ